MTHILLAISMMFGFMTLSSRMLKNNNDSLQTLDPKVERLALRGWIRNNFSCSETIDQNHLSTSSTRSSSRGRGSSSRSTTIVPYKVDNTRIDFSSITENSIEPEIEWDGRSENFKFTVDEAGETIDLFNGIPFKCGSSSSTPSCLTRTPHTVSTLPTIPLPSSGTISPILDCVIDNQDGTLTAIFGYLNRDSNPINVPSGGHFHPGHISTDIPRPNVFQPGRTPYFYGHALRVTWDGSTNLTYRIGSRTATASGSSPKCRDSSGTLITQSFCGP